MSLWQKRSLWSALIWVVVTAGFLLAAFTGDGPAGLLESTFHRNAAAAFVAFGIFAHLGVRFLTQDRGDDGRVRVDERDRTIVRRAAEFAFTATALAVFFACIVLDHRFQEAGSVPVGLVWFVGYSAWICAYLVQAVTAVFLYTRSGAHGEG